MKCPLDNCKELFENKNDLFSHSNECLKNSKYSKTHKICMFNPKHIIKNEHLVEHYIECKQSKDVIEQSNNKTKMLLNDNSKKQSKYYNFSQDESLYETKRNPKQFKKKYI
jgi:hypothetical protein